MMTENGKEEVPKSLNFLQLIWGMIVKPRVTLRTIGGNGRSWIIVAVILLLLSVLPPIASGPLAAELAREAFLENQEQIEEQIRSQGGGQSAEFDAEQAASIASNPIFITVIPAVGGLLGVAIGWLLWSGAIHLLGTLTGGRNSFGQMFQAVVLASIPYGIRNLLQAIVITTSGKLIENPGLSGMVSDPISVEDAIFSPPPPGQVALISFLSKIDIYLFWNLALLVVGIMIVAQLARRKSLGITLLVWVIFTLISLAPTLLLGNIGAFV